jgi:hypothetical protein
MVYDRLDLLCRVSSWVRAAGKPLLTFIVRDGAEMRRLVPYTDNIIFEGFRP